MSERKAIIELGFSIVKLTNEGESKHWFRSIKLIVSLLFSLAWVPNKKLNSVLGLELKTLGTAGIECRR